MSTSPKSNDQSSRIGAEQLAALTGLTDRRHRQIAKAGFFPPPVRGTYETAATLRGLFRYYRESAHGGEALKNAKAEQELRIKKARAENAELDLAERRGDLISTAEMLDAIRECALPIRQRLDALPAEMAARCNPTDPQLAREALDRWVADSLPLFREVTK